MTWDLVEAIVVSEATRHGHDVHPWMEGKGRCANCQFIFHIRERALAARDEGDWFSRGNETPRGALVFKTCPNK